MCTGQNVRDGITVGTLSIIFAALAAIAAIVAFASFTAFTFCRMFSTACLPPLSPIPKPPSPPPPLSSCRPPRQASASGFSPIGGRGFRAAHTLVGHTQLHGDVELLAAAGRAPGYRPTCSRLLPVVIPAAANRPKCSRLLPDVLPAGPTASRRDPGCSTASACTAAAAPPPHRR